MASRLLLTVALAAQRREAAFPLLTQKSLEPSSGYLRLERVEDISLIFLLLEGAFQLISCIYE
jgi:hypothetical protein